MVEVVVEVPIEQVLVGTQQEGSGPAGGVHHAQVEGLGGGERICPLLGEGPRSGGEGGVHAR